ncbi:ExeM/NucH family extracellular endonuclease [Cyanobacterium sp. IPPAS B-1200]|uniref:ExeM/NucH family extracellular endonuclease n=1 Tax=Cyanobacterium sp. IPPAS B-1200 TaxID=1562720 RepID=UPI00085251D0|nr:ExeM/NucH family extracellular endonuclease [Cyanobacterium sp. IPPAS B-1200]OEJ79041.1 hypothetical protein A5482_11330 [Cyanobacterium sp. IPPAS B-1200]
MPTINLTGLNYDQNFDTLANSGEPSNVLPLGWFFLETGNNANETYGISDGSSNSGNTYSYGSTDATDRAFGALLSGSLNSMIGAGFTNNSGSTVTELEISYQGEQWRLGTSDRSTPDRLDFQYSLDATSLDSGTWIDVDSLDFIAPITTGDVGAKDGNENAVEIANTISELEIEDGETFWIRWTDFNASGADDGLGIDDFSLTLLDGEVIVDEPGEDEDTDPEIPPEPEITKIHTIQGEGMVSPLVDEIVTVEAIVVGDFQSFDDNTGSNLRGFYVQEEDSDIDDNSLTSEGLFIFDDNFGVDVNVGDLVRVTGTVAEFTSGSSSLTQLRSVSDVTVVSENNALPTPVEVSFPLNNPSDLEAFEGMLITIPNTLSVTEHFQLGRFGQVVLSSDGDTNQPDTDGRLDQFTQFNAPSVDGFSAYQEELAKRRIVVDDGLTVQNPDPIINGREEMPLSPTNTFRGGDTVMGLTGILDDRFGASNIGNYRIQPTAPIDFQATNSRPTEVPDVGGRLKVASFNVLNYFNGDGAGDFSGSEQRGADNPEEFERQRDKIISAIVGLDADVVGLVEIENDGYGNDSAIQDLIDGLNAVEGEGTYAFVDPGTPTLGLDAIAVGFIYKTNSVKVADESSVAILETGAFDPVNVARHRVPLAVTFEELATGEQFTAVNNHFKSKGSSGLNNENDPNFDQGDGQGFWNDTRTQASQDLANWLATNPTGINDSDVVILGDLNAYAQEDPIITLQNAGYQNLVPQSSYSFVFDGQWGTLDYALATGSMRNQVTGATKWHINADEPNALDYNTNFKSENQVISLYDDSPFRSSDHDPVIVGLNLSSSVPDTGSSGGGSGFTPPIIPPVQTPDTSTPPRNSLIERVLTFSENNVQILYIPLTGRPGDPTGLGFWKNAITENNISYSPFNGDTLANFPEEQRIGYQNIINDFAASSEIVRLFGQNDSLFAINLVYNNAFNRPAEEEGLNYWNNALEIGDVTLANLALEISLGAIGSDVSILSNKVVSAELFLERLQSLGMSSRYVGEEAEVIASEFLSSVGNTIATQSEIDNVINRLPVM